MSRSFKDAYRWDEKADDRQTKQSAKLKAKEQGKQTKQFWRNAVTYDNASTQKGN